jgi:AcrR family transcriptional regulator
MNLRMTRDRDQTEAGAARSAGPRQRWRARLSPQDRRAQIEAAAVACIAGGGIRAFTVDRVAAEAGVSRALIIHHFGSMEGLLAAVYARLYRDWIAAFDAPRPGLLRLAAMVEALVSPMLLSVETQVVWLTLWGEFARNPALRAEHRRQYGPYHARVAAAIGEAARANGRAVDAAAVATAFICLVDGFAAQLAVDPGRMTAAAAREACWTLLEPHVGRPTGGERRSEPPVGHGGIVPGGPTLLGPAGDANCPGEVNALALPNPDRGPLE